MKIHHTEDYSKKRKTEYPDIGDQLDAIWSAIKFIHEKGTLLPSETIEMLNKIEQVKQVYHKPKGKING